MSQTNVPKEQKGSGKGAKTVNAQGCCCHFGDGREKKVNERKNNVGEPGGHMTV